jgi:hypothetical protein
MRIFPPFHCYRSDANRRLYNARKFEFSLGPLCSYFSQNSPLRRASHPGNRTREADQLGKWEIDWACWLLFGTSSFFFKNKLEPITSQRLDQMA